MSLITTVLSSYNLLTLTGLETSTQTVIFPSSWTNYSTITATNLSTTVSTNIYNTTTTTLLPIPVVGQLPLTAQILGETQGFVTFAISDCATPASSCVWADPLTVTAGPRTAHIDGSDQWKALGQLDCTWNAQDANFTLTVGDYSSSVLVGPAKGWVTDPAPSSVTMTLSDKGLRNFVAVTVTKLVTDFVTSVSTSVTTSTMANTTTSTVTDVNTNSYNITTTEWVTNVTTETLTSATQYYWNDARRQTGTSVVWKVLGIVAIASLALLYLQ